jgi:hypothetical protein
VIDGQLRLLSFFCSAAGLRSFYGGAIAKALGDVMASVGPKVALSFAFDQGLRQFSREFLAGISNQNSTLQPTGGPPRSRTQSMRVLGQIA